MQQTQLFMQKDWGMLNKKVPRKNGDVVRYAGYEMTVSNLKLKYERLDGRKILVARFTATCTPNKCNSDIRDTYYNRNTNVFYEYVEGDSK